MVRTPRKRVQRRFSNAIKTKSGPIELYCWPTPNGWKISIMLEGCRLPYKVIPVNLAKGEQFKSEFLSISSNNRMPVMVDADGPGGRSISIRVGCNPAISGTQDGSFLSARRARPRRGRSVAVLADGRDRTSTSSQTSSGGSSACRRVPPSIGWHRVPIRRSTRLPLPPIRASTPRPTTTPITSPSRHDVRSFPWPVVLGLIAAALVAAVLLARRVSRRLGP